MHRRRYAGVGQRLCIEPDLNTKTYQPIYAKSEVIGRFIEQHLKIDRRFIY